MFLSLKTLIQKIVLKASSNFCSSLSCFIGQFSPVHIMTGIRNNFQDHRRLSEELFRDTSGHQKAKTSGYWKDFHSRNFF
jgi:hypothetical protein